MRVEILRIAAQAAWLGRSAKKSTMMSRPLHNTASKTFIMRITGMRPRAGCRPLHNTASNFYITRVIDAPKRGRPTHANYGRRPT